MVFKVQIISALSLSELFTTTSRAACCLFFLLVSPMTSFDLLLTESLVVCKRFRFQLNQKCTQFFHKVVVFLTFCLMTTS